MTTNHLSRRQGGPRRHPGLATAWPAALALTVLAFLVLTAGASAATFNVTRANDPVPGACRPKDCSLREAVRAANNSAVNDRIVLAAREYRLQQLGADEDAALTGDLDIVDGSGRLVIVGKGRGETKITGDGVDRIIDVRPGARASLQRLALAGGVASHGGAIRNAGRLDLGRAAVLASEASFGGGIFNTGAARTSVSRTLIAGNRASFGGGMYDNNTTVARVNRSVFRANRATGVGGGAIYNQNDSNLVINRSTIERNRALAGTIGGGGIYNQNSATLLVKRSTIDRNRALGGSSGGGIFNQNQASARFVASAISNNRAASGGGGIAARNQATTRLTNSTISGNSADQGGGVRQADQAKLTFVFSTIAANRALTAGGALYEAALPPGPPAPPYLSFRGTIVAANKAPGNANNCVGGDPGNFHSDGANLESSNSCHFTRASDRRNAAARLLKLGRYGGPTQTHALKPSSVAVNSAPRKGCPRRDQRGVKRPQGARCDSGSFELRR